MHKQIMRFLREEIKPYWLNPDKKPIYDQVKEMWALYREYKYIPYHYVKYGMYEKNFPDDICDYIPPQLVHRYRDMRNPTDARYLVEDKIEFFRRLSSNNIRTVPCIYIVEREKGITRLDGAAVHFPTFVSELCEAGSEHYFVKPFNGGSGRGIYRITPVNTVLDYDGKHLDQTSFLALLFSHQRFDRYIVQPGIVQHSELARLYPFSVNTIRIDSLVLNGEIISSGAILRTGNNQFYIDNTAAGGYTININIETGLLDETGITGAAFGRHVSKIHPVTGIAFSNVQVPFWTQVRDIVKRAAPTLLPLGFLGWDIAIEVDGPTILEANHDFSAMGCQTGAHGYRRTRAGCEITKYLLT